MVKSNVADTAHGAWHGRDVANCCVEAGTAGLMTIRGLRKTFNDAVVYDDFAVDLPLGQFISIFGPNGCGKSTLINMVSA
jgi:ABC-type transporter Mla maintaining outer membrane lipid asymmetry ATPase subunit MlaF